MMSLHFKPLKPRQDDLASPMGGSVGAARLVTPIPWYPHVNWQFGKNYNTCICILRHGTWFLPRDHHAPKHNVTYLVPSETSVRDILGGAGLQR
jgi:hypothetical protein